MTPPPEPEGVRDPIPRETAVAKVESPPPEAAAQAERRGVARNSTSKIIRRAHMYLALFLTPWMVIYALSGLVLNHFQAVRSAYGEDFNKLEKVEERDYAAVFSDDADVRMIGAQILEHLGLSGSFNVQGGPAAPKLVINRNAPFVLHRITYFRKEHRLLVEKQPLTAPAFVNRTHFRHGYGQPFLASKIWGVIVDLVIVAMVFWVASGLWMWWEIKPARVWGAVFALLGLGAFGIMLAIL